MSEPQDHNPTPEAPPALSPAPSPGDIPVLQKLSSPPFPRSKFPLVGILASVYEHITTVAGQMKSRHTNGNDQPPAPEPPR